MLWLTEDNPQCFYVREPTVNDELKPLLTPQQVAERLAVAPKTVRKWLRDGEIPGIKLSPKVWRVRQEKLEEWIETKARESS